MNYDWLDQLVGPWVYTRVRPTSQEIDLVPIEGLDLTQDLTPGPPAKLLKGEDHAPNHLLGHLSGVLVLDHVQDQDLLLMLEVDLSPHLIAKHLLNMRLTYQFGKDKLICSLNIRDISLEMLCLEIEGHAKFR